MCGVVFISHHIMHICWKPSSLPTATTPVAVHSVTQSWQRDPLEKLLPSFSEADIVRCVGTNHLGLYVSIRQRVLKVIPLQGNHLTKPVTREYLFNMKI